MVSGVNQSKEDISDCKSLRDVAISTKFWPQIGKKSHKNGHNFSYVSLISAEFGLEIWFQLSENSFMTLPYTRDNGALQ